MKKILLSIIIITALSLALNAQTPTLVHDINPGTGSSTPKELTVLGSDLFFQAYTPTAGKELWKYDRTIATLIDINPGAVGSFPNNLTAFGTDLYFAADDGIHDMELWKYDGTTATLFDIYPTWESAPNYLTVLDSDLYFLQIQTENSLVSKNFIKG